MIKTDAVMTFCKNSDPKDPKIPLDTKVFGIEYSKILQAQEFCKNEDLEYCFIGYKDFDWHIKGISDGLTHAIKVTENGIHPEMDNTYLYCLSMK